jgi:hypothetical protein
VGVGHAGDIGPGFTQDAILHQQVTDPAILGTVEPCGAGEDEDGEFSSHGARHAGDATGISKASV